MRQLLLLRHARSAPARPGQDDRDRPLNEAGRDAVAAMRRAMRELGLAPDLVLISPARRTVETLAGLEPWDETPLLEAVEALYLGNGDAIRAVLNTVAETVRAVLLIGHNPGLHEFAATLHDAGPTCEMALRRLADGFPTSALAEFAVPGPWRKLAAGQARLVRFVTPESSHTTHRSLGGDN